MMDSAMVEWRKKKVNGHAGIGLSMKLKAMKNVLKKWQSKVKMEDQEVDLLEFKLDTIEASAKRSGWSAHLRAKKGKKMGNKEAMTLLLEKGFQIGRTKLRY
ncbi:hypothetical protein EZV62_024994 [Acer yangbiense]|uniref:Uncharacterized protein n=1 Tax=Acer yangbiense TaxID=1000413 RepID=A0A5C7GX70_9ROSI|nr:hypothetical protein EZV62_024994 [Acer yangbiense]